MHHYVFEFSGEAGHFRSAGQNHNGNSYTIVGNVWEEDNTTRVTFNKTYTDLPCTLRYVGTLDRQLGILSGKIVDDAASDVRTFSFKHATPNDLRKSGPPVYNVDPKQTRKWCRDFLVMRVLYEDTKAGEQLFRVLSPEEYHCIQSAFESDSELWDCVSYHKYVPFRT